jgi:hypothetical protein
MKGGFPLRPLRLCGRYSDSLGCGSAAPGRPFERQVSGVLSMGDQKITRGIY